MIINKLTISCSKEKCDALKSNFAETVINCRYIQLAINVQKLQRTSHAGCKYLIFNNIKSQTTKTSKLKVQVLRLLESRLDKGSHCGRCCLPTSPCL